MVFGGCPWDCPAIPLGDARATRSWVSGGDVGARRQRRRNGRSCSGGGAGTRRRRSSRGHRPSDAHPAREGVRASGRTTPHGEGTLLGRRGAARHSIAPRAGLVGPYSQPARGIDHASAAWAVASGSSAAKPWGVWTHAGRVSRGPASYAGPPDASIHPVPRDCRGGSLRRRHADELGPDQKLPMREVDSLRGRQRVTSVPWRRGKGGERGQETPGIPVAIVAVLLCSRRQRLCLHECPGSTTRGSWVHQAAQRFVPGETGRSVFPSTLSSRGISRRKDKEPCTMTPTHGLCGPYFLATGHRAHHLLHGSAASQAWANSTCGLDRSGGTQLDGDQDTGVVHADGRHCSTVGR